MPVLITAGLSPQAYRLQRILNAKDVVFADESRLPQIPGKRSIVLPQPGSASFVHEILKACLDNEITAIYPLKKTEIVELSKARTLFSEYNISLIIPSDEWLAIHAHGTIRNSGNIVVLENGILKGGSPPPDLSALSDETGIFQWATKEEKTEYSLYLEDAGI